MRIGDSICSYRVQKGLTQPELARRSGIAQANLSNIERGKRDLNLFTLKKIAFVLGVPAWRIVRDAETTAAPAVWTRRDLEELARAILRPRDAHPPARVSRDLLEALKRVFVPDRKASDKSIQRGWIEALKSLSAKDLEILRQRVNDERMRRRE